MQACVYVNSFIVHEYYGYMQVSQKIQKMVIREIILKVNLFWDLCMQTIANIPKSPEHVDNVPKRPENPDCNVQKVYPKFRHVPV